jgi:hypothetical protein
MIDIQKKNEMRASRTELENALTAAGAVITGKTAKCPFHDDQHKSGSIHEKGGVWTFTCFAKSCNFHGDVFDVMEKYQGKPAGELLPKTEPEERKQPVRIFPTVNALKAMANGIFPILDDVFEYKNPETKSIQMIVMRARDDSGKKHFLQCRPSSTGDGFELGAPPKPWPLYNRGRLAKSEWAIIVEGEKCVHALHDVGIVATTSPGGSANGQNADWTPCAGKLCYLWPDNDASGKAYMEQVGQILERLTPPAKVRWIDPEALDIPEKGDCVEFIEIWGEEGPEEAKRAIEGVIASARSAGAASEVHAMIEATITGKRTSVSWRFPTMGRITQSLLPGTVTMLCGNPEGGKSLLVIDAFADWHERGIPVALYELEDDRAYHLSRFVAQRASQSNFVNVNWVKENSAEARKIIQEFSEQMDSFGQCLYTAPDEMVTLRALGDWVTKMADSGKRIIGIDPITAAETTNAPWQDDKRFLIEAKSAVRRNGASLVLVTHPRLGPKFQGAMAGGAAYSRFSHTIFWLHWLAKKRACQLRRDDGTEFRADVHRMLKILKARNGPGGNGTEIAFNLDSQSIRFSELGIVLKQVESTNINETPAQSPPRKENQPTMFGGNP